jgi:hypothetical protein
MHLLARAHRDTSCRPLHSERIDVVYDFKEAADPYIEDIKYHQVPLCFKFVLLRSQKKAIMLYKLFSTDEYQWLPIPPDDDILLSQPLTELFVPNNPLVGGWFAFLNKYDGDARSAACNLRNQFDAAERLVHQDMMSSCDAEIPPTNDLPERREVRGVIKLLKVRLK